MKGRSGERPERGAGSARSGASLMCPPACGVTYGVTGDHIDDATHDATDDATCDATDDATCDATHDATCDATHDATCDATHDATDDATCDAIHDATDDGTCDVTDDASPEMHAGPGAAAARRPSEGGGTGSERSRTNCTWSSRGGRLPSPQGTARPSRVLPDSGARKPRSRHSRVKPRRPASACDAWLPGYVSSSRRSTPRSRRPRRRRGAPPQGLRPGGAPRA